MDNKNKNNDIGEKITNESTYLRTAQFDVILMDLQMPVMDGFEAIRNIRKKGNNLHKDSATIGSMDTESLFEEYTQCRIVLIAMSANSDDDSVQQAYLAGAISK